MKRRLFAVLVFLMSTSLLVILLPDKIQPSAAQEPFPLPPILPHAVSSVPIESADAQNVELVGHIGGSTYAVFMQGNYAYIGRGPRLTILDISNPALPTVVSEMEPLPGIVRGIYVSNGYAYITAQNAGLRVVDVSNPANPIEVGSFITPGSAESVYVSGSIAYVADWASLRVVDISNPANPTEIGFYNTQDIIRDVYVSGSIAYVANYNAGLRVVDVSNPANPIEVGFYDTPGWAWSVYVTGSIAYIADIGGDLRMVDVSNPANPTEISFFVTPGDVLDVHVSGNIAYLADRHGGLRIVDVSNPFSPSEISFYNTPAWAWGVYVSGTTAYVADAFSGLRIVDASNSTNPVELGFYDTLASPFGAYVIDDIAYVTSEFIGLYTVNVGNQTSPSVIGFYDSPGWAADVYVSGSTAYVADRPGGLRVVDVSNPAIPIELGFYNTVGEAHDVHVSGSTAYVVDGGVWNGSQYVNSGLRVVDVSNPANPTEIGSYDAPEWANSVYVSGNTAYVVDGGVWNGSQYVNSGLRVVDVSNPANPIEVGFYDAPGGAWGGVYVSGSTAYVAIGSGLRVVDVSNPANPIEVGFYDTPGSALDVYVSGSIAYIADGSGLRVVDVSNPANPIEVGFYDTPGSAWSVYASGSIVYVADRSGGLFILRYTGRPYSVSGQIIAYEDVIIDGNLTQVPHPLGYAVVTLTNHTKGTSTTTVSTVSGDYSTNIKADIGDSMSVRANLIYHRNNTDLLQLQYASIANEPVIYIETQPIAATSETSIQQDLYFVGTLPYEIPAGMSRFHLDETALMYHHFQQALDYTIEILNVSLDYGLPIEVYAFDSNMDTHRAHYNAGDASIHIGVTASSSQDPDRPMNREWHEFFHHLMQDTNVLPAVVPPDDNHDGFINSNTGDSWQEGWAELWPMVLAEYLGWSQPWMYADKGNFEQDIRSWDYLEQDANGEWRSPEEYAVAGLLWDLYDSGNSDRDKDPMNMSATFLWWLLVRQNPDDSYPHIGTLNEVYDSLIATLPDRETDIDEIFENHGFFGDKGWIIQNRIPVQEGNKIRDNGEVIGYGGRENRLDAPYFDGAFLLVNLINEQGQVVDNGMLLITIEFEPPDDIYNYSYKYPLFTGSANMVYLPAPWTNYTATVTVQAINSSTSPFSISNLDFWNMIPNSGQDYIAEKTFMIQHQKIYLPLILK